MTHGPETLESPRKLLNVAAKTRLNHKIFMVLRGKMMKLGILLYT